MIDIDFDAAKQELLIDIQEDVRAFINELTYVYEESHDIADVDGLLDKNQKLKVQSTADRLGVSYEQVLLNMVEDPLFGQSVLQKSVSRTGYHGDVQFEALFTQSQTCTDWEKLSNSGPEALALRDGHVVPANTGNTKSIDFYCRELAHGLHVYICAKYTEGFGGSQDNQANDLEFFADNAPRRGSDTLIVLLTDGSHYQATRSFYGNRTFRDFIMTKHFDRNVLVTDTTYFDEALSDYAQKLEDAGLI